MFGSTPKKIEEPEEPIREVSQIEFALRSLLIFLQAGAAYLVAEQVSPFFYQQF